MRPGGGDALAGTRSVHRRGLAAGGLTLLAGVLLATALPPVHFLPGILAFTWLVIALAGAPPGRAAMIGFLFAAGYFMAGLYWIYHAFQVDAARFGPLAVPAVILLAAICAVFPSIACALVALRRWHHPLASLPVLAVLWIAAENLRGPWLLQFPWNPVASVWAGDERMMQALAVVGTNGLGLLTLIAAGLPASYFLCRTRVARVAGPLAAALFVVALLVHGHVRLASPLPADTDVRLRLVQASIPQTLKWDPDERARSFSTQLRLAAGPGIESRDVVIWPESAVPYDLVDQPDARLFMADATQHRAIMLAGGNRFDRTLDPPLLTNSLFALAPDGAIAARYDKVDLVPFGEFLPLRPLLSRIGLEKMTAGTLDFVSGPGRRTLRIGDLPAFSPLICYEAIFVGEAIDPDDRPDWLLNITNDGWFALSAGPFQHAAMARMRAVEEGLPLVRSANNGISLVTDAFGRTLVALGLDEVGVLDAALPAALPEPTLFRRHGGAIVVALVLGALLSGFLFDISAKSSQPGGEL